MKLKNMTESVSIAFIDYITKLDKVKADKIIKDGEKEFDLLIKNSNDSLSKIQKMIIKECLNQSRGAKVCPEFVVKMWLLCMGSHCITPEFNLPRSNAKLILDDQLRSTRNIQTGRSEFLKSIIRFTERKQIYINHFNNDNSGPYATGFNELIKADYHSTRMKTAFTSYAIHQFAWHIVTASDIFFNRSDLMSTLSNLGCTKVTHVSYILKAFKSIQHKITKLQIDHQDFKKIISDFDSWIITHEDNFECEEIKKRINKGAFKGLKSQIVPSAHFCFNQLVLSTASENQKNKIPLDSKVLKIYEDFSVFLCNKMHQHIKKVEKRDY